MGRNCWTKDNDGSKWDRSLTIPNIDAIKYDRLPDGDEQVKDVHRLVGDRLRQAINFKRDQMLFKNPKMSQNQGLTATFVAPGWANRFIDIINDVSTPPNRSTEGKGANPDDAKEESVDVKNIDPEVFRSFVSFFLMADQTSLDSAVENSDMADGADGEAGQTAQ